MKSMARGCFTRTHRGWILTLLLLPAVIVASTSCAKGSTISSGGGGLRTYDVFVQKFRYHGMPTSIPHGPFAINFSNRESFQIVHEMVMVALPSGKSAADITAAARKKGTKSEDEWLHFGEIGDVSTGATISGIFDPPPGNYAIACWQTGKAGGGTGPPHAAIGMVFQFKVT